MTADMASFKEAMENLSRQMQIVVGQRQLLIRGFAAGRGVDPDDYTITPDGLVNKADKRSEQAKAETPK